MYDITHPLPVEYGIIEYISDEGVPVTTFTQQDIDSGLLAYRNPVDLEVGLSQPTYSFKFNGEKLRQSSLDIHVHEISSVGEFYFPSSPFCSLK